jgi:hypothetical protein
LRTSTPPSEQTTSTEPTKKPKVISDEAYSLHAPLADLEERATRPQVDRALGEPSDFRAQVNLTDHSLVSSPATLPNEANPTIVPFQEYPSSSENKLIANIWTSPSNDGTASTNPSNSIPSPADLNSNLDQVIPRIPLPFVAPYIEDRHTSNEPLQCGYCDRVFNRTCDLK